MIQTTSCPECGGPAEIQWRATLESTDGPVEHAQVLCVRKHRFLLPVAALAAAPVAAPVAPAAPPAGPARARASR